MNWGIVAGRLGIFVGFLGIFGAIVVLANKNNIEERFKCSNYNSHESYGWHNDDSHDSNGLANEDEKTKQICRLIMEHGLAIVLGFMVLCMAYIGISALLIQGIKKKRHSLMAPWLAISSILLLLIAGLLFHFIFKALFLALEGLIIYKTYTLYRDIKAKNNESNGQILSAGGLLVA